MPSAIEWTEETWNPICGCTIVSPGCTNCYAMRTAYRLERIGVPHYAGLTQASKAGPVWTGKLALAPDSILTAPLRRRKPTVYFVNSMSDLFHEDVPDEWIDRVFAVMALAPQHTFQVLTKRSARMRAYLTDRACQSRIGEAVYSAAPVGRDIKDASLHWTPHKGSGVFDFGSRWPLPNVWLGVSAEDQRRADERILDLLATPAAVRFVSAEPLLGRIEVDLSGIDWVIAGGESGPNARPMHPDWARSLRDQCAAAEVPFFFKQWGHWAPGALSRGWGLLTADGDIDIPDYRTPDEEAGEVAVTPVGKARAGRLLDGREHNDMPAAPR